MTHVKVMGQGLAEQLKETKKTAETQMGIGTPTPVENKRPSPEPQMKNAFFEALFPGAPNVFPSSTEMPQRDLNRLKELENRLKEIREKRVQDQANYVKSVSDEMTSSMNQSSTLTEAPQPVGKAPRMWGRAKKAVTSVIQGRKQGETKSGSGKG